MSTQERPPWPEVPEFGHSTQQEIDWLDGMLTIALKRLREAKGWLKQVKHPDGCDGRVWDCTCGLDEFLADMLPEGEEA